MADEEDGEETSGGWAGPPADALAVALAAIRAGRGSEDFDRIALLDASARLTAAGIYAPEVSVPPPPSPPPALAAAARPPPPEILRPALDAFFAYGQKMLPIVHEASFRKALGDAGTPSAWGAAPPLALMYALAALGTLYAHTGDISGLSASERRRAGRYYGRRAKELVMAGYLGKQAPYRTVGELEAAQTMILLVNFYQPVGQVSQMQPLLQRLSDITLELCLDRQRRRWRTYSPPQPATWLEWAYRDMLSRLWVIVGITDISFAFLVPRAPFFDYWSYPAPISSCEVWFDAEDPAAAFAAAPAVETMDLTPLLDPTASPRRIRASLSLLASGPFLRTATFVSVLILNSVLRHLTAQLRDLALAGGFEPLSLPLRDASRDTEHEHAYRALARHMLALVSGFFSALGPWGASLAAGDLSPFFAAEPSLFPIKGYSQYFLLGCVHLQTYPIEAAIQGDPAAASPDLVGSAAFLAAVEAAVLQARIAAAMLASDPLLRWTHSSIYTALLRGGYLLLACARAAGPVAAPAAGVSAVLAFLAAMAPRFAPLGPALAARFAGAIAGAGLPAFPPPAPPPAHAEEEPGVVPALPDAVVGGGQGGATEEVARSVIGVGRAFKGWTA